jgi:hypothetical protein
MVPDGSNQAACDPGHVRCRSARITGVAGMKDSAEPDSCCFRRHLGHRHVKDATGLCDAAPIDAEIVDSEIVANRVRRSPDLCVVALTCTPRWDGSSLRLRGLRLSRRLGLGQDPTSFAAVSALLPAMVPWDFVWDFTPARGA